MNYGTRVTHSNKYYAALVRALIDQLTAQRSDKEISEHLNSEAILTARGGLWKAGDVKAALHKVRNYATLPNKLHQAINQLCFDQVLRPAETLILFATRRENGVM